MKDLIKFYAPKQVIKKKKKIVHRYHVQKSRRKNVILGIQFYHTKDNKKLKHFFVKIRQVFIKYCSS